MKTKGLKFGLMAIATVAVVCMQTFIALAADFPGLQAYGVDTIAGYSTLLRSSKTYPNSEIKFVVTKPDGAKVQINAMTDEAGLAKLDLYDYHARKAGIYGVSAMMRDDYTEGAQTNFTVFPDEVSLEQSVITANSNVAKADGSDKAYVSVILRDQYGNPFEGHQVNLISSRAIDSIQSTGDSGVTDKNGSVTFGVTSSSPGVSVFSAVDSTSGIILTSRAQVAFLSGDAMIQDAGGSLNRFIPVASAAEAGPLHHFEIGDIPATVNPGDSISFRVTAMDSANLTVENYTGTIHFSAEGGAGDGVSLPEDYTFKADDLGTHTFSLGLSFTTKGTYKVIATDTTNISVKGEVSVAVGAQSGTQTQQTGQKPTIVTPAAGSYSENVQNVSGNAPVGTTVKIYDNDQEIGSVQTGSAGSYSFQTNSLADGLHKIYVVTLDQSQNVQGTSDTVEITIDTKAPEVDDITVNPTSGIKPGTVIDVKVMTEQGLSDAALIFNSEIVALTESPTEPGVYNAQITAPANPGAYPLDVVLVDELNNEETYQAKATVNVSEAGGSIETPVTEQTQETQTTETQVTEPANNPPSEVFGLIAYGTDKRVTLVWEAANDDKNVNHYRVYYGLDPANLDNKVDTKTAATTWYVPNLQNGKEYYFAVSAVDDEGLESAIMSQTVSAIPFTLEVTASVPVKPTGPLGAADNLHGASIEGNIPPEMSKNGPEVVWLFGFTGLLSGMIGKFRRGRKKTAAKQSI
jgi:hypothetical protein